MQEYGGLLYLTKKRRICGVCGVICVEIYETNHSWISCHAAENVGISIDLPKKIYHNFGKSSVLTAHPVQYRYARSVASLAVVFSYYVLCPHNITNRDSSDHSCHRTLIFTGLIVTLMFSFLFVFAFCSSVFLFCCCCYCRFVVVIVVVVVTAVVFWLHSSVCVFFFGTRL